MGRVSLLIEACGGTPDEDTTARIGLLVQACAATPDLVRAAAELSGDGGTRFGRSFEAPRRSGSPAAATHSRTPLRPVCRSDRDSTRAPGRNCHPPHPPPLT